MYFPNKRAKYTSEIVEGKKGPIFRITAEDMPADDLAVDHDSTSGAWLEVLKVRPSVVSRSQFMTFLPPAH